MLTNSLALGHTLLVQLLQVRTGGGNRGGSMGNIYCIFLCTKYLPLPFNLPPTNMIALNSVKGILLPVVISA